MTETEDYMVQWYHQLKGHEFEQALGVGDGQGSLACCSPWDSQESSPTSPAQKHQFFSTQLSLWSNSHIQTWLVEKP